MFQKDASGISVAFPFPQVTNHTTYVITTAIWEISKNFALVLSIYFKLSDMPDKNGQTQESKTHSMKRLLRHLI